MRHVAKAPATTPRCAHARFRPSALRAMEDRRRYRRLVGLAIMLAIGLVIGMFGAIGSGNGERAMTGNGQVPSCIPL